MRKSLWVLTGIILALLIAWFFISAYTSSSSPKIVSNVVHSPAIHLNYSNMAEQLSKNSMVKALPTSSFIILRFYNFNSGQRVFEKSYLLSNSGVEETELQNADITILISSKYLG